MKLNKLKSFLAELDARSISYVSWKNNHELHSVMSGNGDIDLFVLSEDRSKFIDLCKSQGWLEVVNPIAKHPWINHFYGLGDDCIIFHMHVYFKLITGETWIKEYSIPFDKWIINNRVWNTNHDIWVVNKASQAYLFIVRHMLKCSSFSGRLIYKREIASYEKEWQACRQGLRPKDINGPIDIAPYIQGSRVFEEKLKLPKISSALHLRSIFYPFLRFKLFSLPFRRFLSFFSRLMNKFFFKQKKMFSEQGITIAISGVDGSGKTSMLQEVENTLGNFLTINRFHLGRPQGKFIEFIWRFLGNNSGNSKMPGTSDINTPTTMWKAINGAILAILRIRKARHIVNQANLGGLMLVDRWPTAEVGKMDGPRIILGENPKSIQWVCKRIETWAYNNMPPADICYFFVVPVEVAIERNRFRKKTNKETEEMISARFFGNLNYKPIAKKVIRFDNSGQFSDKKKELINNVWRELSTRH